MLKRFEIYIWNKRQKDGSVSRFLCSVVKITNKNIEVVRWDRYRQGYFKYWVEPETLTPATITEKQIYLKFAEDRKRNAS